jgi:hypothetical protein
MTCRTPGTLLTDFHHLVHLLLVVAKDHGDIQVVQQLGDFIGHGWSGRWPAAMPPTAMGADGGKQHFRDIVPDQGDGIAFF